MCVNVCSVSVDNTYKVEMFGLLITSNQGQSFSTWRCGQWGVIQLVRDIQCYCAARSAVFLIYKAHTEG